MTEAEAEAIAEDLSTYQSRVRLLLGKYGERFRDLHENYTLVDHLYFLEYGDPCTSPLDHDVGHHTLHHFIEYAAMGRGPKVLSIHRALTIVKKDFQTAEQRRRSAELEEAQREALTPDPGPDAVDYGFAAGEHRPMSKAMLFFLHFKDSPEPENIPKSVADWHPEYDP